MQRLSEDRELELYRKNVCYSSQFIINLENFLTFKHIPLFNDAISSSEGVLKLCKD